MLCLSKTYKEKNNVLQFTYNLYTNGLLTTVDINQLTQLNIINFDTYISSKNIQDSPRDIPTVINPVESASNDNNVNTNININTNKDNMKMNEMNIPLTSTSSLSPRGKLRKFYRMDSVLSSTTSHSGTLSPKSSIDIIPSQSSVPTTTSPISGDNYTRPKLIRKSKSNTSDVPISLYLSTSSNESFDIGSTKKKLQPPQLPVKQLSRSPSTQSLPYSKVLPPVPTTPSSIHIVSTPSSTNDTTTTTTNNNNNKSIPLPPPPKTPTTPSSPLPLSLPTTLPTLISKNPMLQSLPVLANTSFPTSTNGISKKQSEILQPPPLTPLSDTE
ncbi:hypothetical protein WA158_005281 [Blastocystis sp. Blastoise]